MEENPYESSKLLGEYLLFHYGREEEILPWSNGPVEALNFCSRTVESLMSGSDEFEPNSKALDIGCAVGASSFVLGKYFGKVLGVDFSKNFIEAANKLKKEKFIDYSYLDEGDSFGEAKAIPPGHKGDVCFEVGDAMNIPDSWSNFDLVHAANLICRLPSPQQFLDRIPGMVKQGGQLLLATPFTWLEEYTPRNEWLGSGDSREKIQEILSPWFQLEYETNLPFLIREHRRKYQYSVSWGTRWRRI